MKRTIWICCLLVGLVVGGMFSYGHISTAQTTAKPTPPKWEYMTQTADIKDAGKLSARLNNWGNEGWELITVNVYDYNPSPGTSSKSVVYHYKRPK